ncbi:hypothetical protein BB8028_0002g05490 [Beauveria bassiana]|uniref:Structure-specific endonuclease subunit SLX4 n=1 Tax=Beauveria bassiana TaxID=176275 RepID=A0A2S7Y234_BEABA|nr:hypothetical protein BB8028_0002g05490 [Beauveria bassiana]
MASPEMFLSSPLRPRRRIATSPLVISSSPDLPPLQDLGSRPPKPPIFRSTTPTTPIHQRSRTGLMSAPEPRPETVNLSPTPETSVHESHYRSPKKAKSHQSLASHDMAQECATLGAARQPLLLSSSPAGSQAVVSESKYFQNPTCEPPPDKESASAAASVPQETPLNLQRAPVRRLDWTPPKQRSPRVSQPKNASPAASEPVSEENGRDDTLSKVLEAYKCDDTPASTTATRSDEDGSIFRKRKLIDAVSTRSGQDTTVVPEPAIVKKKAPSKKKPRTITGLATAAYKLASQPDPDPEEEAHTRPSKAEAQTATITATNAPAKKTRKRTSKAPKKTRKKEPPPKPVLLSPSAALRQVANQDFLFGTSSQLAQEQSPGFLRDLARAMKHSNEIDYASLSTPINSDAIEPPEARRSLWDAAARDEAGDVFDLGIQELAQKSQDLPSLEAQADPFGYVKEASPTGEDSFLSLSDALKPQEVLHEKVQTPEPPTKESCSQDAGPVPPVPTSPGLPPRPKFELYTDAQLASAVSSYGFKNVRQRGARIALLDKCWQGRNQNGAVSGARFASTLAGQSTRSPVKSGRAKSPVKTPARPDSSLVSASQPQEPPPSAQQPISPPKRPRGRPRKSPAPAPSLSESASLCAAALLHPDSAALAPSTPKCPKGKSSRLVVEIPDSESDADGLDSLSASPSSVPDEMPSPSQGVDLSLSMDQDAELSIAVTTSEKPASFEYISKSVTSAPRSKDVSQPSWHEKILLYDPIIIEDLTAWLNCGPLTKAGYDDEVSSGEVKKWCESKSICCLWKVNLRGKERKRY